MDQEWYQGWGRAGVTYQPGPNSHMKMLLALRECVVGFVGVGCCRESSERLGMSQGSAAPQFLLSAASVWVPHPCCHNECHLLFPTFQQCEKWTKKDLQRRKTIFQVPLTLPPKHHWKRSVITYLSSTYGFSLLFQC